MTRLASALSALLFLAACSGGGSGGGDSPSSSLPLPLPLPTGHGLSAGDNISVAPGGSDKHGNVVISCPAGGNACVLSVAADGSASYDQTGGMPSVMPAFAAQTLPTGHGLSAGDNISVAPGGSDKHGNVVISCPAGGNACVLNIAADGSASYDLTGGVPTLQIVPLIPGPGQTLSSADPVYEGVATSQKSPLHTALEKRDNIFPVLSSGLRRNFGQPGSSELSSGLVVKTIRTDDQGNYVLNYVLDNEEAEIIISRGDNCTGSDCRATVDGRDYYFWSWTQDRTGELQDGLQEFQYMASFNLSTSLPDDVNRRTWFVFGVRTENVPMGTAEYKGRFRGRSYLMADPSRGERQNVSGMVHLVANFDVGELHGNIDVAGRRSFTITNDRILNGQFTATLTGMDDDPNFQDFMGDLLGEFYGPQAEEIGGVVTATRDVEGTENDRVLYGFIGGKRSEPRTPSADGLFPLNGRLYGEGKKALIVLLHGSVSSGGPADYLYSRAERIAMQLPDVTVAAVLRPGYYDREGRESMAQPDGDDYSAENNRLVAETISNLKAAIMPEQVIAVGHSAGAIQLGAIVGQRDNHGLIDGLVLVGCSCDLEEDARVRNRQVRSTSQSPSDFVTTYDPETRVYTIIGTNDPRAASLTKYNEALKREGITPESISVAGAGHGFSDVDRNNDVLSAINHLLAGTQPPPVTQETIRQEMLGTINEIQERERANNSTDDVVHDILRIGNSLPRGLTSRSLGVGSTTQSSFLDDTNQTTVRLSFLAEYDTDGMPQFRFRNLNNDNSTASVRTTDEGVSFTRLEGVPAQDWKGVELKIETETYKHFIDMYSDVENGADTDYLAMGYWLRERKEKSATRSNYALAIGAGGSDPFGRDDLAGLTGTATYEGPATGLHMKRENPAAAPMFDYFNANVTLTANFGDGSALGTVSGTVTQGVTVGGEPLPDLTLGAAEVLGNSAGGNFYGDTSGNGLTGKWGGKFYGNGAGSTDHPDSVAGTFGAKTADDLQSFIGAFGAYKN